MCDQPHSHSACCELCSCGLLKSYWKFFIVFFVHLISLWCDRIQRKVERRVTPRLLFCFLIVFCFIPFMRQIYVQYRWQCYNATALGRGKFREEYASKNYVYSLFVFHLVLFFAVDCHPAFFARYLHKVEEWPKSLMLSAALNAFSALLSIP